MTFQKKSLIVSCFAVLCLFAAVQTVAASPQAQGKVQQVAKININTADISQLQKLPGIGPSTAERIVEYRKENGPFKRIEELMNVRGIGQKKFDRIKDQITVQ